MKLYVKVVIIVSYYLGMAQLLGYVGMRAIHCQAIGGTDVVGSSLIRS